MYRHDDPMSCDEDRLPEQLEELRQRAYQFERDRAVLVRRQYQIQFERDKLDRMPHVHEDQLQEVQDAARQLHSDVDSFNHQWEQWVEQYEQMASQLDGSEDEESLEGLFSGMRIE